MKSKMKTSGNSVLSNRTVIGLICIVLALALTFGVAPIVNRLSNQKVSAVLVKRNVERGHIITAEDVEVVQVVPANLSSKTVGSTDYVVGKYAASNLYAGQMMIADLVTEKGNSAEDILAELNGEQVAISLQIPSFAAGISGKVANGDIVSIIVYSQKENKSYVPDALRYVRVITTTTAEEVDCDRKEDGEQSVTITLLASPEQAELLAYYEATAKLHFSLVCRGDKKIAEEFLRSEAEYLQSEEFALALSELWGEEGETAEERILQAAMPWKGLCCSMTRKWKAVRSRVFLKETANRKDGIRNGMMNGTMNGMDRMTSGTTNGMTSKAAYLNTQLYEKVCAEMTELEQKLLSLPPEEILLHAYEYVIKQDIVFALQEYDVSEKQAGILLKSGNALEDIFGKYENTESDYMVHIQDVIECTANEKLRQAFLSERKAGRER